MPAFLQTLLYEFFACNGSRGLRADTQRGKIRSNFTQSAVNGFWAESTAKQLADRLELVDPVAHRFDGHQDRHP